MFILNPDPYLLPSYLISPFQTSDIASNLRFPVRDGIDDYFSERFGKGQFTYLSNGRKAIGEALKHYNLNPNDIVTILTTSENFYISGCVTAEIERFCKWNREITTDTKVILVNHEFGYPYKNLEQLKKYNLPIVEDCAHSFFSEDVEGTIGTVGDFVIYSFPKMFPLQIGGLLVSNVDSKIETDLSGKELRYIKNVLSGYIDKKDQIIAMRKAVYSKLLAAVADFGFTERFPVEEGVVPGVFMFNVNDDRIDLDKMKKYLYRHGIQCSVFYGERAFFIPVHQRLEAEDILYFKEVIGSFLMSFLPAVRHGRQSD